MNGLLSCCLLVESQGGNESERLWVARCNLVFGICGVSSEAWRECHAACRGIAPIERPIFGRPSYLELSFAVAFSFAALLGRRVSGRRRRRFSALRFEEGHQLLMDFPALLKGGRCQIISRQAIAVAGPWVRTAGKEKLCDLNVSGSCFGFIGDQMQRGLSIAVFGIKVGFGVDQRARAVFIIHAQGGGVDGRVSIGIGAVDIRTAGDESGHAIAAIARGMVQGDFPALVLRDESGPRVDERLGDVEIRHALAAAGAGRVQEAVANGVALGQVGSV